MTSARTRELLGLVPVSLLVSAGFAAVLITRSNDISDATLTYGAIFLGLCVVGHIFIRAQLPDADPYMFPLAALLAAVGLVEIYRIDPDLARKQAQWFVGGLVFFVATVSLLRDHHVLERYRYTIAAASILLLMLPRVPGIGAPVNGAYLAIRLPGMQFQPAEFAKLGIIVFLASYLREAGDVLVRPRLRPVELPRQLLLYGVPAALALAASHPRHSLYLEVPDADGAHFTEAAARLRRVLPRPPAARRRDGRISVDRDRFPRRLPARVPRGAARHRCAAGRRSPAGRRARRHANVREGLASCMSASSTCASGRSRSVPIRTTSIAAASTPRR